MPTARPLRSDSTPGLASRPRGLGRDLGVGLALAALAAVAGVWMFSRPDERPRRQPPGPMVVDTTPARGPDGAYFVRVRIAGPVLAHVDVTAPAGSTVAFGPARPVEAEPLHTPDPATATTWTLTGGRSTKDVRAFTTGMYTVHVRPTGEGPLRVRVTTSHWRTPPRS